MLGQDQYFVRLPRPVEQEMGIRSKLLLALCLFHSADSATQARMFLRKSVATAAWVPDRTVGQARQVTFSRRTLRTEANWTIIIAVPRALASGVASRSLPPAPASPSTPPPPSANTGPFLGRARATRQSSWTSPSTREPVSECFYTEFGPMSTVQFSGQCTS